MAHWCEFCQMEHTSASCYHPGRAALEDAHIRIDFWKNTTDGALKQRDRLRAQLEEALDIVECVADGLKREPRQLQQDAIALLEKREAPSA